MIQKPFGVKGQVRVRPLTDDPSRFKKLTAVLAELTDGEKKWLEITQTQVRGETIILRFKDFNTREAAKDLSGASLSIGEDEVLPVEEGAFYHFEVIGFRVMTKDGEFLGHVERVLDLPANDVLVVQNKNREVLIPVIKDVIQEVDRKHGQIIIDPIEGLLS